MSSRAFVILSLFFLGAIHACAANFTFTYSDATECDDFDISWTGGTPPFTLTIVPSFQVNINLPIPDSAFANGHGSYTTPMRLRAGNETVVVLSDSTGFGSGGVSPLITVGKSVGHSSCDIKDDPKTDFVFSINGALSQCRKLTFGDYAQAVQPLQITGVVAGGSTFVLNPPTGSKSFNWVADVAAGTQVLFFMVDSQGRQGGTENAMTVLQSGDASCLNNRSPASVSDPPSLTATSTASSSTAVQTGTLTSDPPESSIQTGILIAAIVVPVVVAAMLVIGAVLWCRRRRRQNRGVRVLGQPPALDLTKGDSNDTPRYMQDVGSPASTLPFLHDRSSSVDGATLHNHSHPLPSSATTSQFTELLPPTSAHMHADGSSRPAAAYRSGARRKAAEAGVLPPRAGHSHPPPTQFIIHTDIEDSLPPPAAEVVELPPQYSERHAASASASRAASSASAQPLSSDSSSPQP